jgi:hypothetical protein
MTAVSAKTFPSMFLSVVALALLLLRAEMRARPGVNTALADQCGLLRDGDTMHRPLLPWYPLWQEEPSLADLVSLKASRWDAMQGRRPGWSTVIQPTSSSGCHGPIAVYPSKPWPEDDKDPNGVAMSKTWAGQSEVSGGGFHLRPEADGDNP